MTIASPTIVTFEPDSAWIVILAVSAVTLPVTLLLRHVLAGPGGLWSGMLMVLPVALPVIVALFVHGGVLPEVAVLRPIGNVLLGEEQGTHLLVLPGSQAKVSVLYAFTGSAGRYLLLVAIVMSLIMLLRRLIGARSLRRAVRRSSIPDEEYELIRSTLGRLAAASGLKHPPQLLLLPQGIPGVFVSAGRHPKILIAGDLIATLDDDEIEAVLAHEIAHLAARDVPIMAVGGILRDLVAWNPLGHLALRRLIADRECEADRRAAELTSRPLAVASSLVKTWEHVSSSRRGTLRGAPAFAARQGALNRRVSNLLALVDAPPAPAPRAAIPFVAAACLAVVLAFQVGDRIVHHTQGGVAIVLGASSAVPSQVWLNEKALGNQPRDAGKTKPQAKPRERQARSLRERFPAFADGFALKDQDFPRFARALTRWAEAQGLSPKPLLSDVMSSWRATPLFERPSIGPFGFYRMSAFERVLPGFQR